MKKNKKSDKLNKLNDELIKEKQGKEEKKMNIKMN